MVCELVTEGYHKLYQTMSDIPLEDAKRPRPRNPFQRRERENFPSLDAFFGEAPDGETIESEPPPDDGESSSILNMSIGARAALTEHLRHVLKHGIDGEQTTQENIMPRNILDEKWEGLLEQLSNGRDTSGSRSGLEILSSASSCLEQSIEVMTDISHDFFNSARVQSLATPERNRDKIHHVSTREDNHIDFDEEDDFLGEEDEAADTLAPELLMIIHSSSSEEHRHSSFQSASFCVPDISRISSADDSEPRPLHHSPDSSFQFHHNLIGLEEQPMDAGEHDTHDPLIDQDLNAPDLVLDHHHETSCASMPTPKRALSHSQRGVNSQDSDVHHSFCEGPLRPKLRTPRRSNSAPGLALRDSFVEKENQLPRNMLKKDPPLKTSTEQSLSALDTMPSHFMEAIELVAVDHPGALSPISQNGSYHVNILYESSSSSSRRRNQTKRTVPTLPFEATVNQDVSTSSSSCSLSGRKRFRTVVPRRVYMDSPSQCPNEQDSFGNSTPENTSDDQAQRSLLDSFEAAVDELPNNCGSTCYTY